MESFIVVQTIQHVNSQKAHNLYSQKNTC